MTKQSISFSTNPEVYIFSDKNNTYNGKYIGKVARLVSKNENSCLLLVYGEHILVDSHDVCTVLQKNQIEQALNEVMAANNITRQRAIESMISFYKETIVLLETML